MGKVPIKNPGNTSRLNRLGKTPLHYAAQNGHYGVCKLIIDNTLYKNPVTTKQKVTETGVTPLHWAARFGHLEVCKLIMEKVNNKNPSTAGIHLDCAGCISASQQTPFHWAAEYGQFAVCKYMIEIIPDKNPATESQGLTPLHLAAFSNHLDVCKLIMDYDVDKNPKDKVGTTPLHFAARRGNLELCRLFLDNMVFINSKWLFKPSKSQKHKEAPYETAQRYRNEAVCSLFESYVNEHKDRISHRDLDEISMD